MSRRLTLIVYIQITKKRTMFSEELESLIQATLEDGILENYEKAALVKRAQVKGLQLD